MSQNSLKSTKIKTSLTDSVLFDNRKTYYNAPLKIACDLWKDNWSAEFHKIEDMLSDESTNTDPECLPFTVPIHHFKDNDMIALCVEK